MIVQGQPYRTVSQDGPEVRLIDQPLLPHRFQVVSLHHHTQTARAISEMVVRGAGAIGATAAAGMAQAALEAPEVGFHDYLAEAARTLSGTRPTAQNLFWAIGRVLDAVAGEAPRHAREAAVAEARAVADEDAAACEAIGRHGAPLIRHGARVSTHCNAGWLAFVDWGSALSPLYRAQREGRRAFVWVDETRPRSQGARLTAWELAQEGVDCAIIADNAAGALMARGEVDLVITGADRVAANGDVANKIGTYSSAAVARLLGIPFYVALPSSTLDLSCPSGAEIPIEERSQDEVLYTWGWSDEGRFVRVRTAPPGARARNLAFDVTPGAWITGLITERGIFPATSEGVRQAAAAPQA
ncbi:MAG: S-methyl-5-thioribose-1-phosphate isomerase [Deltaproteobacteria bacterium]|nr:S-methyl-5-thioribose-1-phosphate isomerase [Deltaproteobacteria bacterium]